MRRSILVAATAFIAASVCAPLAGVHAQTRGSGPSPKRISAEAYPLLAHLAAVQGNVQLAATVSPEGAVLAVRVVGGAGLLVDPAKAMLSRWQFSGCNAPDNCEARVEFHFILESGTCADECPSKVQIDLPATVTIMAKHRRAIVN